MIWVYGYIAVMQYIVVGLQGSKKPSCMSISLHEKSRKKQIGRKYAISTAKNC